MENKYIPELGQEAFGQPYLQFGCSALCLAALESISVEWDRVMWNIHQEELPNPFGNTGASWTCDYFEVHAYDWNEDNEQPFNFKWKNIEISWYKYLGRGMSCNRDVSLHEISEMLDNCLEALIEFENKNNPHKA
jgi:hypothetical protein